ncbi:hypothetical protein PHYSODRAFT_341740 [Phytophthora sojae]|uniref:Uncharacterized protein n=1 Tax=Phytophthora sojae (strain P6497) TaxID=1094619 RepID=G5AE79_PHYSP|nr:hypothetical protein PHYSODRAFT_341740 [Phytophthora sojae]EGZ06481.1 hypothetical protein PHYSODRAFT_341740 [Phytophthora sojae]|eukprot:XP_009538378.1 hypothetical protein PHYSODRAFT_341740 [Phytophthora sojae]
MAAVLDLVSAGGDKHTMTAGVSGSGRNGYGSAVSTVNSMVSEASAVAVDVLDVIGGVSAGMVTNATVAFGSSSERNDSSSPHGGSRRCGQGLAGMGIRAGAKEHRIQTALGFVRMINSH